MKAILHIGMPKTGSTSIQSWLAVNREALARQGVAYDRLRADGHSYETAHVEMAVCVFNRLGRLFRNRSARAAFGLHDLDAQRRFSERYEAQLRGALAGMKGETFVISSEYFAANLKSNAAAEAARDWVLEFFDDIEVVLYFRRQEDIVPSSYAQRLSAGADVELETILRKVAELNYKRIARRWKLAVGGKRFRVQLLERDELVGGDLLSDFAHVLGVDDTGFRAPAKENSSGSAAALALLRDFNARTDGYLEDGSRNPEAHAFKQALFRADAEFGGDRLRLTDDQHARIRTATAESNEALRRTFFAHRDTLFPERPRKPASDAAELARQTEALATRLDALRTSYQKPITGPFRRIWDRLTDQPST